uniref:Uncharacterized protein n=1 Tax=Trepomonas sp. PC1 TaxID=1076344 RepID=A0A146KIS4_9EUKA|eukprot:JAP96562.1 hypothetical protein TPC1_10057 [Trepomonas sp. PC1]
MYEIAHYFTDPLLRADSLRQSRQISYYVEKRGHYPGMITEIQEFSELLTTIYNNLQSSFINAAIADAPVFDDFLMSFSPQKIVCQTVTDIKIDSKELKIELLVEPLLDLLQQFIGNGLYYESKADMSELSEIDGLFNIIGQLYLNLIPKILQQDKQEQQYYQIITTTVSSLAQLLLINEDYNKFTQQQMKFESNVILSRIQTDLLVPFIQNTIFKQLAVILHSTIGQLKSKNQYQEDVQLIILQFINDLLRNPLNISDLFEDLIEFLVLPLDSKRTVLALSILQQINFKTLKFQPARFAKYVQNALFLSGGLQVSCSDIAESQLALLNVICQVSKFQPAVISFLCQDCDIKMNQQPKTMKNQKRKPKIVNNRIIDDDDSDDHQEPIEEQQEEQMPRSTSPMLALQPHKQQFKYCNFITDYLIQFFKNYGQNQYHSSRELQKILKPINKEAGPLRKNVYEGHSVNYVELNKLRVETMNEQLQTFKMQKQQLNQTDVQKMDTIKLGGDNIQTYVKLVQLQNNISERDKTDQIKMATQIRHTMEFSHKNQLNNDDQYKQQVVKMTQKLQSTQEILQQIDQKYERFFIIFCLKIFQTVFNATKSSPVRQIRAVLQEIDGFFVQGLVSFVDKVTDPALSLIFSILTYPQKIGQIDQWVLFFENGLLDFINRVNHQKEIYGAIFICRLFSANWQQQIPAERVQQLTESLIESFIGLLEKNFAENAQQINISFSAVSILCNVYAQKVGDLSSTLSKSALEKLSKVLSQVFDDPSHLQTYQALLCCQGLFSKTENSARRCYDLGLVKSVSNLLIRRVSNQQLLKIEQQDVVLVRFFTDLVYNADQKLKTYLKTNSDFQQSCTKLYKTYQKSLQNVGFDDVGAILPQDEMRRQLDVLPRSDVYKTKTQIIANSPSTQVQEMPSRTSVLSPTRSRNNVAFLQNSIAKGDFEGMKIKTFEEKSSKEFIPQQHLNVPTEARYLLKLNFTATVLGLFRALYPEITRPDAQIVPGKTDRPTTGHITRPLTGQTPQIGQKIPIMLPSLSLKAEKVDNDCVIQMYKEDCLVLLQMMAQNAKESLIQLNMTSEDQLVPDDRLFLDKAIEQLQTRIQVLQSSANQVVQKIVKEKVEQEAKFYLSQKK